MATTRSVPAGTIHVESVLPASADQVFTLMQYPATFTFVARGLLGVPSLSGRLEPFVEGEVGSGWLFFGHVVPAWRHTIEVVAVDGEARSVVTHEYGGLLRRWDHTLHVEPIDEGRSRYSDTVVVDAGLLTPIVVFTGRWIYRYRQRRWPLLLRRNERTSVPAPS